MAPVKIGPRKAGRPKGTTGIKSGARPGSFPIVRRKENYTQPCPRTRLRFVGYREEVRDWYKPAVLVCFCCNAWAEHEFYSIEYDVPGNLEWSKTYYRCRACENVRRWG